MERKERITMEYIKMSFKEKMSPHKIKSNQNLEEDHEIKK